MRQHHPIYQKIDGRRLRSTLTRAFVRFLLERTQGNQARSAELAGISRSTVRKLITRLNVDWLRYIGDRNAPGRRNSIA